MGAEDRAAGSELEVWIQPRASRDEVVGFQGGALKVRVTAPPVEGEANQALIRFLGKQLGVPPRDIRILRGKTGRRKTLHVRGLTLQSIRGRLGL